MLNRRIEQTIALLAPKGFSCRTILFAAVFLAWHVHPGRDTTFADGPGDLFDHAAPTLGLGQKMGIDATRKLTAEGHPRNWPAEISASEKIKNLVASRWNEYGLDKVLPTTQPDLPPKSPTS